MAEWSSNGDYTLLGPEARILAQVGPQDAAFAALPGVIPQRGGSKSKSKSKSKSRTIKRARNSRKRHHSRKQKGGMAPFGDAGRTLTPAQYAADGTNPQFRDESLVNERYSAL
jgi:hypothetical protein